MLTDNGEAVCLIKPQFEAGRENVGKKGVVRDPKVHENVVTDIMDFCLNNGYSVLNLDFSPVKGPEGNIEYLCYIEKAENSENRCETSAAEVVESSYKALER